MTTYYLQGTKIKYSLQRYRNAKKMRIRIIEGNIKVTAPTGISESKVKAFVESHKQRILQHLEEQSKKQVEEVKRYEEGAPVIYQGFTYPLHIERIDTLLGEVKLGEDRLTVFVPRYIQEQKTSSYVQQLLIQAYKQQAEVIFKERIDHFAVLMGVKYNTLRIKDQKTKWGSCSSKKNINLNYRLILAPQAVMDYVIVHELAHLIHMNHSKEFWHIVEKIQPHYKKYRQWLKEQGHKLHL